MKNLSKSKYRGYERRGWGGRKGGEGSLAENHLMMHVWMGRRCRALSQVSVHCPALRSSSQGLHAQPNSTWPQYKSTRNCLQKFCQSCHAKIYYGLTSGLANNRIATINMLGTNYHSPAANRNKLHELPRIIMRSSVGKKSKA